MTMAFHATMMLESGLVDRQLKLTQLGATGPKCT